MGSKEVVRRLQTGDLPVNFNWNTGRAPGVSNRRLIPAEPTTKQILRTKIVAEDLRDGIHGVRKYPSVENMALYIDALAHLGIDTMTVGIYPGKGTKVDAKIKQLLGRMREDHPEITPVVLLLAQQDSLNWGVECLQVNPKLQPLVFMGSSPSRMLVQEWTQDSVLKNLAQATEFAAKEGMTVIGATEHTTQTPPDFLRKIISAQVDNGAKIICAADTVGTARPIGAYRLIHFIKDYLKEIGRPDILVDWHGHRDKGNEQQNAMVAIAAGADRIHTVARGIGERAGNTPLEGVLVNATDILKEHGLQSPWNMQGLSHVLDLYDEIVNVPHPTHGMLGENAFTTSLGIHADGYRKARLVKEEALRQGDGKLAGEVQKIEDTLYSGIDPKSVGRETKFTVSPSSGQSSVIESYAKKSPNGSPLKQEKIEQILTFAKSLDRELTDEEFMSLLENGH